MTRWQPRIEMPTGKAASTVVYAVSVMFLGAALSGCSALIGATATNPDRYVRPGMTKSDLAHKLGAPLTVEHLDPPVPVRDIADAWEIQSGRLTQLIIDNVPLGPAAEKHYYSFRGRLRSTDEKMDDAASIGLVDSMTFFLFELVATPVAAVDVVWPHDNVLVAWFDESGNVLAYQWTKKQYLAKSDIAKRQEDGK